MKKFLHPPYGLLIIELLIFLGAVDAALICFSIFRENITAAMVVPISIVLGLYAIYLLYVLIEFAVRFLRPIGTLKELIEKFRKDKHFRRVCTSYLSSIVNLGMSVWYISYAFINQSPFYFMASQYMFIGFIGRIYLLYLIFTNKEDKINKGFAVSAILTLFLGIAMQAITILCVVNEVTVRDSQIMTLGIATYTFVKFIAAIVSLVSSVKHREVQLLSFCILSMSMAFYSMFMLVITMPVTFGNHPENEPARYTAFGFLLATLIMAMGICSLIYYHRLWKKEKEITADKKEEKPIIEEEISQAEFIEKLKERETKDL